MRFFIGLATGALVFVAAASPASAQLYNGSFTGTVTNGTDTSGYFTGTAGASLDQLGITGTFQYDASFASTVVPGEYVGPTGQFLNLSITLASTNYAFGGFAGDSQDFSQVVFANGPDSVGLLTVRAGSNLDNELISLLFLPGSPLAGLGLQPFGGGASGDGLFQIATGGTTADGFFSITSASAQLQGTNPGAVPEPATWLQMMFGIGVAGVVLRRRRGMIAGTGAVARA
jgi:hypothetical protein